MNKFFLLQKRFSDLIKKKEDFFLKLIKDKKLKSELLNIRIPSTTFNPRYYKSKNENILTKKINFEITKIQSELEKTENTKKIIFDNSSTLKKNGLSINEIFSKLYSDFEHKFKILNKENSEIIFGLNILGKEIYENLDKDENINTNIRQGVQKYIQQMIRWGFTINSSNFYHNLNEEYISCLYETFFSLYKEKLILKGIDQIFFSFEEKRGLSDFEFNIVDEPAEFKILKMEVKNFGDDIVMQKMFENRKVFFLVTVKENLQVFFSKGILLKKLQNYAIYKCDNEFFISSTEFVVKEDFFRKKAIKQIDSKLGSELIGFEIKNPLNQEILGVVGEEDAENFESGIGLLTPSFNYKEFEIAQNWGINCKDDFDENGRVLKDMFFGRKFYEIGPEIDEELKKYYLNTTFINGMLTRFLHRKTEERLLLKNQNYYYLNLPEDFRKIIYKEFEKIDRIGPQKGMGVREMEYYILNSKNKIKITEKSPYGIPVPILHSKRGRGKKIMINKNIIENYKNALFSKSIDEWNSIETSELVDNNSNFVEKDENCFNVDFLKSFNFFYILNYLKTKKSQKKKVKYLPESNTPEKDVNRFEETKQKIDTNIKKLEKNENPLSLEKNENIKSVKNDLNSEKEKKEEKTENNTQFKNTIQYPFNFTSLPITSNPTYLLNTTILQILMTGKLGFKTIKNHGVLVDNKNLPLEESSEVIIEGIIKGTGEKVYGYGSDVFRLFTASVDLIENEETNLFLRTEFLNTKLAEINVLRNIYFEIFKFLDNGFVKKKNFFEDVKDFPILEKMVFNQLQILIKILTKAYREKDFNKVYTVFFDFMKYTIYDFYLGSVKRELISDFENDKNEVILNLLAEIVDITTVLISPILPCNSENVYNSIKYRDIENCVFREEWPSPFIKNGNVSKELLEKLENLKLIKKTIEKKMYEIKAKNEEKKLLNLRNYEMFLIFAITEGKQNYKEKIIICENLISDLNLKEIFEVTNITTLINEDTYIPPNCIDISTNLFIDDLKIPIFVKLVKIEDKEECRRCQLFIKEFEEDFCKNCQIKVDNESIRKLIK